MTYKDQNHVSTLSLGEESYIMDLASQKQNREALRQEEALEETLDLYKIALEETNQKESQEVFLAILQQVKRELDEEYKEKDRLHDQRLEAALQAELDKQNQQKQEKQQRQKDSPALSIQTKNRNMSSDLTVEEIDDRIVQENQKILKKKIKKCEAMMQEILDKHGEKPGKALPKYQKLEKKQKMYQRDLEKGSNQAQGGGDVVGIMDLALAGVRKKTLLEEKKKTKNQKTRSSINNLPTTEEGDEDNGDDDDETNAYNKTDIGNINVSCNKGPIPSALGQENNGKTSFQSQNMGKEPTEKPFPPWAQNNKMKFKAASTTNIALTPKMTVPSKHVSTTKIPVITRKPIMAHRTATTENNPKDEKTEKSAVPESNNFASPPAIFTLKELQSTPIQGVLWTRREEFLSDPDFQEAFKMNKEAFSKLPKWKQSSLKKRVGLF